jgi:hypothetical protein
MSDFWKAIDEARSLARREKTDACVVYLAGAYHAKLLSKADPFDVVVEVADDHGAVANRFVRRA